MVCPSFIPARRHCRIALPGMKNIPKSINQLDKSHTALMGKHDALERRVEVLEERNGHRLKTVSSSRPKGGTWGF